MNSQSKKQSRQHSTDSVYCTHLLFITAIYKEIGRSHNHHICILWLPDWPTERGGDEEEEERWVVEEEVLFEEEAANEK